MVKKKLKSITIISFNSFLQLDRLNIQNCFKLYHLRKFNIMNSKPLEKLEKDSKRANVN